MSSLIDRMLRPSMAIRFQFLFTALLLMLTVPVVLRNRLFAAMVPILFTVLALTALAAVAEKRSAVTTGVLLAIPALLLYWLFAGSPRLQLLAELLFIVFLVFVTSGLIRHSLRAKWVTGEVLFAVACVYLLLALIWAMGFGIVDGLMPGALVFPEDLGAGEDLSGRGLYMYFSFVTLTTLGYGDIAPASDTTRMMAMLEATLGQLFLVIVVARLVGMHTAQYMEKIRGRHDPK
ncbi:MAG: ion channel [Gemmatimonadales bacterium]|jgi:voltage-gated potassium channel